MVADRNLYAVGHALRRLGLSAVVVAAPALDCLLERTRLWDYWVLGSVGGRRLGVLVWVVSECHAYALDASVGDALLLAAKRDASEAPWLFSSVGVGMGNGAREMCLTSNARVVANVTAALETDLAVDDQ